MAEIHLILTCHDAGGATSVAIAETGMGIASISQDAIVTLRTARDQIEAMLNGSPRMSSAVLLEFGLSMGRVLFAEDVRATVMSNGNSVGNGASGGPLVAKILATAEGLKGIPWEYAAWPPNYAGPLATKSVVRIVPQAQTERCEPADLSKGLRVLLLSANPIGLQGFSWQQIRDRLVSLFQHDLPGLQLIADDAKAPAGGAGFVRIVEAAIVKRVRKVIADDDPHIVHFIAHGSHQGIVLVDSSTGQSAPLGLAGLSAALGQAESLRLVILSSCDGANAAFSPNPAGVGTLAEHLVRTAAPAVVASQMVLTETAVVPFCEGLYRELMQSGSIDAAVAAGRCALAIALDKPDSAAVEWGVPALYRRMHCAQLLKV